MHYTKRGRDRRRSPLRIANAAHYEYVTLVTETQNLEAERIVSNASNRDPWREAARIFYRHTRVNRNCSRPITDRSPDRSSHRTRTDRTPRRTYDARAALYRKSTSKSSQVAADIPFFFLVPTLDSYKCTDKSSCDGSILRPITSNYISKPSNLPSSRLFLARPSAASHWQLAYYDHSRFIV